MDGAPALSLVTIPPELPWFLVAWMKGWSSKDIFCPLPINVCGYCFQLSSCTDRLKRKCRSDEEKINLSSFPPVTRVYVSVYREICLYSSFFTCTLLWLAVDLSRGKGMTDWSIDWLIDWSIDSGAICKRGLIKQVSSSSNASDLYLYGSWFKPRLG